MVIRFDLGVDRVYRGDTPTLLQIDVLRSGVSFLVCTESILRVEVGDVIALALDGRVEGVDGPVNTVAWIRGRPDRFSTPEVERITEAEIRPLLELPPTDGDADADASVSALPLIATGSVLGLLFWLGRRRKVMRTS